MDDNLTIENTLANIENRWAASDRRLLAAMFPLLAEGRAWSAAEIAERLERPQAEISAALGYPTVGVADDRLVELYGLMLSPTLQRVVVDERALFACCALVAHGLPAILRRDVDLEAVDPVSRSVVRLQLHADGNVTHDRHAHATIAVAPPRWGDVNVRDVFCSHVRHFASPESAQRFAAADPRRQVVSIERMHELGMVLARAIWG